jgi:hypothetical protein
VAPAWPVLVLISADPRVSGRAVEAMRIGVGVVAGDTEVVLVLRGPAAHLLDADADDLVDGDDVTRLRDSLRRLGVPFHVETDAIPSAPDWNEAGHPVVPVSLEQVAALVARGGRCLVF